MKNLELAKNPRTPPETLKRLANDKNYRVRRCVAWSLNATPETLERLANDEEYGVRVEVAWNPNTPPETLVRLANDYYYVRNGVAQNPNTPRYIKDYFKIKNYLSSTDTVS